MTNISEVLEHIENSLRQISDTPGLDAQIILAHTLDKSRTWLVAHPETDLTKPQFAIVEEAVSHLLVGTPLPYLLGHWEFYGLDFEISEDVLIPRPETELLVERAIKWLKGSPERRTIADIGTGSGCIAVAITMNIYNAKVIATDLSLPALEIAHRNACKHRVQKRIDFVQCDLLPPHPDPLPTDLHFDLICANLPYIPTSTLRELPIYGHEPTMALDGGVDGLDIVRRLLKIAPEWLAPNGMILLEIEASQGLAAVSLAYDTFDNADIYLHQDLAGHDRLLSVEIL